MKYYLDRPVKAFWLILHDGKALETQLSYSSFWRTEAVLFKDLRT
jgi:hypothetical protein